MESDIRLNGKVHLFSWRSIYIWITLILREDQVVSFTVDSRYLEDQETLLNTSRYLYQKINRTATFHKWLCNLTPEVRNILKLLWVCKQWSSFFEFRCFVCFNKRQFVFLYSLLSAYTVCKPYNIVVSRLSFPQYFVILLHFHVKKQGPRPSCSKRLGPRFRMARHVSSPFQAISN